MPRITEKRKARIAHFVSTLYSLDLIDDEIQEQHNTVAIDAGRWLIEVYPQYRMYPTAPTFSNAVNGLIIARMRVKR